MTTETAMQAAAGRNDLGGADRRGVALARLAIGLAQGVLLYLLVRTSEGNSPNWSERHPELFSPAVIVALFLPAVLLSGVGKLRPLVYAVWSFVAAIALAFVAWHDIARQAAGDREATAPMFAFAAAALFIAHHLIVPADRERRLIAPYPAYFDAAWMAGVQLALSIGFAGAFWLLLFLGAALFNIIGLSFLGDLMEEAWFALPMTGLAFATAVQLTDVRDGLIRGVRTVALMLLSWLLLVLTVLVGAFLLALPFTGLDGLWETGSATALVLAAAGVLVVLVNAAYQDGRPDNLPPSVLRIAVRVASVLLTPLILIAAWGLSLRIGQHGLTPDRIIAVACALVGAAYAGGYGYAALSPFWSRADWMRPLERTNIAVAVLVVAVILALFTPVADPDRLSVADQTSRLERGKVSPAAFDYSFLRFESGKTGTAALQRLTTSTEADIAARARQAQAAADASALPQADGEQPPAPSDRIFRMHPASATLPADFTAAEAATDDVRSQCIAPAVCHLKLVDLTSDGVPELLVMPVSPPNGPAFLRFGPVAQISVFSRAEGVWTRIGGYSVGRCGGEEVDVETLFDDGPVTADPIAPDLMVGGGRFAFSNDHAGCLTTP